MRILRIEAVHFGAIAGRVLELPAGLVVLHGPNESGKSTTMDLIRGVLFGFPPLVKTNSESLRLPRGGYDRSGIVTIGRDDGMAVRVERTHGARARIFDQEGAELGEVALRAALGGADETLFRDVLTFNERDLARFSLLDGPAVRDGILGAAMLGGGVGIDAVIDSIDAAAKHQYTKSGTNNLLNERRRDLLAARERLRTATAHAAAHESLLSDLESARAVVGALEEDVRVAAAELDRLALLWEICARLRAVAEVELAVASQGELGDVVTGELAERIQLLALRLPVVREAQDRATEHAAAVVSMEAELAADCRRIGAVDRVPRVTLDQQGDLSRAARTVVQTEEIVVTGRRALAALQAEVEAAQAAERAALRDADKDAVSALVQRPAWLRPDAGGSAVLVVAAIVAGVLGWWSIAFVLTVALVGLLTAFSIAARQRPLSNQAGMSVQHEAQVRAQQSRTSAETFQQRAATAEAALPTLEQDAVAAAEAWSVALGAVGVGDTRAEDVDELIRVLAAIEQRAQGLAAAVSVLAVEQLRVDAFVADAQLVLVELGVDAPSDPTAAALALGLAAARVEVDAERVRVHQQEAAVRQERAVRARVELAEIAATSPNLIAAAEALDVAAAEAERGLLGAHLDELRVSDLKAANQRVGIAREAVRQVEESADVVTAAQEVARAEEEYRRVADDWLTLRLAHHLAVQTRDRFVAERQPAIIMRAAGRIATATDGDWRSLRLGEGDKAGARSVIVGRNGDVLPVSELSAGAVGLVYLCLRIGLVEELAAKSGISMPVVMDDVLTHLDREREAGAARLIADLATQQQVIYLTCHDQQVDALRAVSPELTVISLERLTGN